MPDISMTQGFGTLPSAADSSRVVARRKIVDAVLLGVGGGVTGAIVCGIGTALISSEHWKEGALVGGIIGGLFGAWNGYSIGGSSF